MTGYEFHPEAVLDLDEIWEFIGADSLDAADRIVAEIISKIRSLVLFPRQGHRRLDLSSRLLRFVRVRDYLIAYSPTKSRYGSLQSCTDDATRGCWPRFSGAENSAAARTSEA